MSACFAAHPADPESVELQVLGWLLRMGHCHLPPHTSTKQPAAYHYAKQAPARGPLLDQGAESGCGTRECEIYSPLLAAKAAQSPSFISSSILCHERNFTCFGEGHHDVLAAALVQREEDEVLKGQLPQIEDHVERQADLLVPEVHQDDLFLVRPCLHSAQSNCIYAQDCE